MMSAFSLSLGRRAASDPRGALNITCKEALEEVVQKGNRRLQRELRLSLEEEDFRPRNVSSVCFSLLDKVLWLKEEDRSQFGYDVSV